MRVLLLDPSARARCGRSARATPPGSACWRPSPWPLAITTPAALASRAVPPLRPAGCPRITTAPASASSAIPNSRPACTEIHVRARASSSRCLGWLRIRAHPQIGVTEKPRPTAPHAVYYSLKQAAGWHRHAGRTVSSVSLGELQVGKGRRRGTLRLVVTITVAC